VVRSSGFPGWYAQVKARLRDVMDHGGAIQRHAAITKHDVVVERGR